MHVAAFERASFAMSVMGLVALAASPRAQAQGGPPMITDDTGTPGDGRWEINIAAVGRHGAFGSELNLPLLDINYGLSERVQLKYEIPWVTAEANGAWRSGVGNSLLGIKWRFYDHGEHGWRASVYPQVETRTPGSDSARRGLVEEGTSVVIPFELERALGPFTANIEAGHVFSSRGDDTWFGGIVAGHGWAEKAEGLLELHAEAKGSLDDAALAVNVGVRVDIAEGHTFLLSVGRDLQNSSQERATVFGYIGWQLTF